MGQNTTNVPPSMIHRPQPEGIDQQLNLTGDQAAKVNPLLLSERRQIMDAVRDTSLSRDDKRAKIIAIRKDTTAQMQKILTPEQFQKWQRGQLPGMRRTMMPLPIHTNTPPTVPAKAPPAP